MNAPFSGVFEAFLSIMKKKNEKVKVINDGCYRGGAVMVLQTLEKRGKSLAK